MAFVLKSGSRYQVRKGNTGEVLSSFSSKEKADSEVSRLHKKFDPLAKNRGAAAKKREIK